MRQIVKSEEKNSPPKERLSSNEQEVEYSSDQLHRMSTAICNTLAAAVTTFQIDHDPSPKSNCFIELISNSILGARGQNRADIGLSRAFSFVDKCFRVFHPVSYWLPA